MKNIKVLLLLAIFVLGFALRFYKLGVIPAGLAQDETSIGYNAYSILKTGKDEYGKSYPINFKAFGEYKLPGYIYLTVPSIAVFGTTPLAVRLPSAVIGFLTVVIFYFFVKQLTKREDVALVATFLLAVNPWHVHFSRAAFEVVPALFFVILAAYLFLRFVDTKKQIFIGISALFFLFSAYTYNICRVFSPLLFLGLAYNYRKHISFKKSDLYIGFIPAAVMAVPFLLSIISHGGASSTAGTLIFTSAQTQASILQDKSIVFMQNNLVSQIFFNKFILTGIEFIKNVLAYFSVSFLFLTGSDHGNHGIGNVGMFYIFDAVFILFGLISFAKKKENWVGIVLFWFLANVLVAALTREAPQASRSFFIIPPLVIISAFGAVCLYEEISKHFKKIRTAIIAIAAVLITFNILFYLASYYFRFPTLYSKPWREEDGSLVSYIKQNQDKYDVVLFDDKVGFEYTSLLYDMPYSPAAFQKEDRRAPDDSEGFSKVRSFGKYEFGKIDSENLDGNNKVLVITTPEDVRSDMQVIKTFYYPDRPVAIADGQNILQYPTKDVAYVVAEKK